MLHKIKNHKITRHAAKILGIKLKILLFVILPFVVITLLTAQTNLIKGYKSFVVLTGSMEPNIPVGSIVYTRKTAGYGKGDIISFTNARSQTITHRVTDITKKDNVVQFKTKGDANNVSDTDLVPNANVVGKVIFQVPYVGRFIGFIKTPIGFGLIIVLPTLLFILGELWNIKREIEKDVEKKVLARVQAEK